MKIYTKTGDLGETSLFGGSRVQKNHPRLNLYGELDALNSHIGFLCSQISILQNPLEQEIFKTLAKIQSELFVYGSHFATEDSEASLAMKKMLPTPDLNLVELLENEIDRMTLSLAPLKNFILPGGNSAAAYGHVVRTHSRSVERITSEFMSSSQLSKNEQLVFEGFLVLINRTSDYFFTLSRYLNQLSRTPDKIWIKSEPT